LFLKYTVRPVSDAGMEAEIIFSLLQILIMYSFTCYFSSAQICDREKQQVKE